MTTSKSTTAKTGDYLPHKRKLLCHKKNAPRRVRFCFMKADCKSAVVLFDGHVMFEICKKVFLQIGGLLESNQNDFSETLFVKGNQRDSVLVDLAPRERRTKRNA